MAGTYIFSRKWGVTEASFTPLHPHVGLDEKTFKEALDIGSACEDLARERLHEQKLFRAIDSYCDRMTTDIYGQRRNEGKRILLDGIWHIAPDFKATNSPTESYFIDVKAKQYHSFYHKSHRIQQVVDVHVIHDYLAIGAFYGVPVLILIHLFPSGMMGAYGKGQTARIHTGLKWDPLTEDQREALVRRYPVDDWYYLINACTIQQWGRQSGFQDIDEHQRQGYYFDIDRAVAGPAQGVLPPLDVWQCVAQEKYKETPP